MFYIHHSSCISPQQTFRSVDLNNLHQPVNNQLQAMEPDYAFIPAGMLRRMGKATRMAVGAGISLIRDQKEPDGIIIGTANAGKEDCVKFLNQIIDYDEGMLTPLNFVNGTPNAIASQIGILEKNHGYNITHMHQGLAFENAMIDADMCLEEMPQNQYLLGAVDDISTYNYYFEDKGGWYKEPGKPGKDFYENISPGSIAGEAAIMFLVSGARNDAMAKVAGIDTLHHQDEQVMKERLSHFISRHLPAGERIDLLLSGENGDSRLLKYFNTAESLVGDRISIARFKHMSGEFPTASAMALWLVCNILQQQSIPGHMIKRKGDQPAIRNVLIYNNYKFVQHSFILVSVP
jgi:hypothetical protein